MLGVHSLIWWDAEQKVLRLELQFFVNGLTIFFITYILMKLSRDHCSTGMTLVLQVIIPEKARGLLLGDVHCRPSRAGNEISDGTTECWERPPWPFSLTSPKALLLVFFSFFLSNGDINFSLDLGDDVYIFSWLIGMCCKNWVFISHYFDNMLQRSQ